MTDAGQQGPARKRRGIGELLTKAPFAIIASSLQGFVNYFIVLYLTYDAGAADTGTYRALFSFYSLLGLASMFETNKVFIRSIVADDKEATTALFANRMLFSWGTLLLIGLVYGLSRAAGSESVPVSLLLIAGLSAIIYPLDSYLSFLQARGRFQLLFWFELVKYSAALATFLLMLRSGASIESAVLAQLAAMALCHVAYFSLIVREFVDFGATRRRFGAMIRSSAAGQARTYSVANIFPASLEHVDKLLVGWMFGLEFLGIYTLAYSTGRFLYNALKPALYVYYRRFVDRMPGPKLLRTVTIAFTIVGLVNAALFVAALAWIPEMEPFRSGAAATIILFLSYGTGILHAVYGQAFALNKDSEASHALRASILATAAAAILLCCALLSEPGVALVLLALQYPLRDVLSVWLMARLRRS
ncbi:MAG TPA: oligosaccharide flippase family protein [Allosphingosinicella sp.]